MRWWMRVRNLKMARVLIALAFITTGGCTAMTMRSTEDDVQGRLMERSLDRTVERRVTGGYLLYLPQDYDASRKWPLLLFLHGAGERGDSLARVALHGPPKLIREATMQLPFIVVAPQVPEARSWSTQLLDALLEEVAEEWSVDEDRIYVTGLSMGGHGTWALAFEFPHRFAAIAPIAGGGLITGPCTIPHLPVWAFHGAQDQVVTVSHTDELVERLRGCGGHVRYTRYEDAAHDSWTRTYANPELYDWLLSHRRGQPAPADATER